MSLVHKIHFDVTLVYVLMPLKKQIFEIFQYSRQFKNIESPEDKNINLYMGNEFSSILDFFKW